MGIIPAEEREKLLTSLNQELFWLLAIAVFQNGVTYSTRKEIDEGMSEGVYFLQNKQTMEPEYAGSARDVKKRQYNQRLFIEDGENYWITIFDQKHTPLDIRLALEALLKILFLPRRSQDNHKARMTEEKINALRFLVHKWIDSNTPKSIKQLLEKAYPLPTVRMVESDQYSSWDTCSSINHKKFVFVVEIPENPSSSNSEEGIDHTSSGG